MEGEPTMFDALWPGVAGPDRLRRLFVSANPGPGLIRELSALQSDLRRLWGEALGREVPVYWIRAAQFHLTLAFPGSVASSQLPELSQALEQCAAACAPGSIEVGGIGTFPAVRMPRIVWVGVVRSAWIVELMEGVRDACSTVVGRRPDEGVFPHITLGRVKAGASLLGTGNRLDEVRRELEAVKMTWHIDTFQLMESLSTSGEGKYAQVGTFRMEGARGTTDREIALDGA